MKDHTHLFTLRLRMCDGNRVLIDAKEGPYAYSETGHTRIDVRVRCGAPGKPLREVFPFGATYCGVSRYSSMDGDAAKALVLSLVGMRPGDTDSDYFASYTDLQLGFASKYGDELDIVSEERYGTQ